MTEKKIGTVEHYYPKPSAAVVHLEDDLHVGDRVHIQGRDVDFSEEVRSMEMDHEKIKEAHAGDDIGLWVPTKVPDHADVYKIVE